MKVAKAITGVRTGRKSSAESKLHHDKLTSDGVDTPNLARTHLDAPDHGILWPVGVAVCRFPPKEKAVHWVDVLRLRWCLVLAQLFSTWKLDHKYSHFTAKQYTKTCF